MLRILTRVDSAGGQYPITCRFLARTVARAPAVWATLGCAVHPKSRSTRDRLGVCCDRLDHVLQLRTVCHPRSLCDRTDRVALDCERQFRPTAARDASCPDRWRLPRLVETDRAHAIDMSRDSGSDLGSRSAGRPRSTRWHGARASLEFHTTNRNRWRAVGF